MNLGGLGLPAPQVHRCGHSHQCLYCCKMVEAARIRATQKPLESCHSICEGVIPNTANRIPRRRTTLCGLYCRKAALTLRWIDAGARPAACISETTPGAVARHVAAGLPAVLAFRAGERLLQESEPVRHEYACSKTSGSLSQILISVGHPGQRAMLCFKAKNSFAQL